MKNLLLLLSINLFAVNGFTSDRITFDCQLRVSQEGQSDFLMKGLIRINDEGRDETSYLTLEPPSSVGIPVTARVLLTRFQGNDYFPMTLHPRGDTAVYIEHGTLEGKDVERLELEQDGFKYHLVCGKRSLP